jgi:ATP-binding cassette subfamily B protein
VRENLLYGRPSATERELEEAAKAAQIHATIAAMPEGYGSIVGEHGYMLSGGERQRLAIARVILADPRILLLDEATSALDTLSERLIREAIARLREGRTTIAIAHRLSTVIASDQILVVQGGKIRARGPHDELIDKSDLYRRLYEEQFTVMPVGHVEPESVAKSSHLSAIA